jgi:hypothetical protein
VKKLYEEYLEFPNSHVSHELLHTHYVKRGRFNEYLEDEYVNEEVIPMAEKNKTYPKQTQKKTAQERASRRVHEDLESVKVMALEAEVTRLKQELNDSQETVEILKDVMSDYAKKPKR